MRILLTNDDGITASGIRALHHALTDPDDKLGGPISDVVFPIAPLTTQSATSHGVTFHQPLMVTRKAIGKGLEGFAVDGRPADCVKVALAALWPRQFGEGNRPDLVISGMNAGANVGVNVIYSGTVAAAIEAAFLGVPSIAVSLHLGPAKADFDAAAVHARRAIEQILATGPLAPHDCINVNIPRVEFDDPKRHDPMELAVCPMNTHGLNDKYERRESPWGDDYYWACGGGLDFHTTDEGSDVQLLFQRRITVTPLWYDLTSTERLGEWRRRLA